MIILTGLSGVLIKGIHGMEDIVKLHHGADVAEKFQRRREETNFYFREVMRGNMDEDCYWHLFFRVGHFPFDAKEAKAMYGESMKSIIPGTLNVYRRIAAHPRTIRSRFVKIPGRPKIYLVGDYVSEWLPELRAGHPEIFELISREFWSFEQEEIKGNEKFFRCLLQSAELAPKNVVFVDADTDNISSAALVGIRGIHFTDADQLESDLSQIGFRFRPKSKP